MYCSLLLVCVCCAVSVIGHVADDVYKQQLSYYYYYYYYYYYCCDFIRKCCASHPVRLLYATQILEPQISAKQF
jgi:hypothetical protein